MSLSRSVLSSALVILASHSLAAQDSAQATAAPAAVEAATLKREGSAMLRGIIPGAGHFYAGERTRGTVLASAFVIGVGLIAIGADEEWVCVPSDPYTGGEECFYDLTAAYESRFYTGVGLSLGAMLYSIVDARFAARRANRRNGLVPSRVTVVPHVIPSGRGAPMAGITLRGSW